MDYDPGRGGFGVRAQLKGTTQLSGPRVDKSKEDDD